MLRDKVAAHVVYVLLVLMCFVVGYDAYMQHATGKYQPPGFLITMIAAAGSGGVIWMWKKNGK